MGFSHLTLYICAVNNFLISEGFANIDDRYTTSPIMLEETEKLLKDQPSFCKIVRKTNKQYEVKMWLMNTGEASDEHAANNNVLSVNERLLAIKRLDCNQNCIDNGMLSEL